MSELDNFITHLNALETNFGKRLIALESKPIILDHSKEVNDLYQKLIHLQEISRSQQTAIEAHGKLIVELKAGIDSLLAQAHTHDKPKFSFWK